MILHLSFLNHKKNYCGYLLFFLLFCSCSQVLNFNDASIYGSWKSPYGDSYVITDKTIQYDDGGYGFDWSASIELITDKYVYFKYVTVGDQLDKSQINNYSCISYKNLSNRGCQMSTAYKENKNSYYPTLEEVKNEIKIENGYFEFFGEYEKF